MKGDQTSLSSEQDPAPAGTTAGHCSKLKNQDWAKNITPHKVKQWPSKRWLCWHVSSEMRQCPSGCCLCYSLDELPFISQLTLDTKLWIHQKGHRHAGVGARRVEVRDVDEEKCMKLYPFLPAPAEHKEGSQMGWCLCSHQMPFWQQRTASEVQPAL